MHGLPPHGREHRVRAADPEMHPLQPPVDRGGSGRHHRGRPISRCLLTPAHHRQSDSRVAHAEPTITSVDRAISCAHPRRWCLARSGRSLRLTFAIGLDAGRPRDGRRRSSEEPFSRALIRAPSNTARSRNSSQRRDGSAGMSLPRRSDYPLPRFLGPPLTADRRRRRPSFLRPVGLV